MSHRYDDVVFGRADPDCGLKVGMLATTYHKGYWVITEIEQRFHEKPKPGQHDYRPNWPDGAPMPSIVRYRKVADEDGTPCLKSKRTNSCCATYCHPVDMNFIADQRDAEVDAANKKMNGLHDVLIGIKKGRIKP